MESLNYDDSDDDTDRKRHKNLDNEPEKYDQEDDDDDGDLFSLSKIKSLPHRIEPEHHHNYNQDYQEIYYQEPETTSLPQQALEQLHGFKQSQLIPSDVSFVSVSQKEILASAPDFSQGHGQRTLTNAEFARRNNLTQLLRISRQQDGHLSESHEKAKRTRREASKKYGW